MISDRGPLIALIRRLVVAAALLGPGAAFAEPSAPIVVAQADQAEVTFWESVRDTNDPAELEAYLQVYPDGHFAPLAKIRLNKLKPATEAEPPVVDAAPDEVQAEASLTADAFGGFAFQHGVDLLSDGEVEQAIPFLQMAVGADPEDALYREVIAGAYLSLGTDIGTYLAIDDYQMALELDPGRRGALEGLKMAALLADAPLIALDANERLFLDGDTVRVEYLPDLGPLYIVLDQPARGIALLERAADLADDNGAIKLMLASLHQYDGDTAQTVVLAREVLAETGGDGPLADIAAALVRRFDSP